MNETRINETLGYVTPVRAYVSGGRTYMQSASGKVAEALAKHYAKVCICARVVHGEPPEPFDPPLDARNLELVEQPYWSTTTASLLHPRGIACAYIDICRRSDAIFVRGMCPYIGVLYLCAAIFRKPVCHWIVGDPVAVLSMGTRNGIALDTLGLVYALQDRFFTRLGRWGTDGALLCNGRALARAYASPRTIEVASSTVQESEFFHRTDTCQGRVVRILFVGFLRPEKGIEYLLDAVSRLDLQAPWTLDIVGPREFPDYCARLERIAAAKGITDRIRWFGYLPNGKPLFERMRAADLLVLPSLSEGTPHVLTEARASGLPCVATDVGGIPTCVEDGYDALLVPPRDSRALARAMEQIVRNGEFRRALIRNGFASARKQTLERFVRTVLRELKPSAATGTEAVRAG